MWNKNKIKGVLLAAVSMIMVLLAFTGCADHTSVTATQKREEKKEEEAFVPSVDTVLATEKKESVQIKAKADGSPKKLRWRLN